MRKKKQNSDKNLNMKELLFTMFKIGCIGFGGGTALVPVIESEVVYEKKLIDKDEYTKDVVVANITPGALPVEVAAGVGRKVCGVFYHLFYRRQVPVEQDYPFNGDHSGILPVCGTDASDQQFKGAVWVAPYHDRTVNLWTVQWN